MVRRGCRRRSRQGPADRRADRELRVRHATDAGRPVWAELDDVEQRKIVDAYRLAYVSEAPVNWCPGLGTVLANEEVTAEGRSERGNFPVFKRNLRQWMMRITAYADRLVDDLDRIEWPDKIKTMQRNWIGRSHRRRASGSPTDAGRPRGLHHAAGHDLRRDVHGASRRSIRWSTH